MVNLPGNLAPGTWYIGALADYENQIGESNEANNNGNYLTITVPPPGLAESETAPGDVSMATCWAGSQLTHAIAGSFAEAAAGLPFASQQHGSYMGEGLPLTLAQPTIQL